MIQEHLRRTIPLPESIPYGARAFHLGEGIVFVGGLNTPKIGRFRTQSSSIPA